MARKEKNVKEYVWVDWAKASGMIIGLAIAIAMVIGLKIWL